MMGKFVKENLSQLVRRVVTKKNLKLRDVQDKSGGKIDESYVSRIMTGNASNITLDKLVALAKGIGEDAHTLFAAYLGHFSRSTSVQDVFELDIAEFGSLIQKLSVNPDLIEIIQEIADLHEEERKAIRSYVQYLSKRKGSRKKRKNS